MPSPTAYGYEVTVKVNGAEIENLDSYIERLVVDSTIGMPSMFHLVIRDPDFTWMDGTKIKLGAEVIVSIDCQLEQKKKTGILIKGLITSLEGEFEQGIPFLHVRGYDKGIKLTQGKKTRSFLDSKDSDIASKIGGECGISVQADTTSTQFKSVLQINQSDWDFLKQRADDIGYQLFVREDKLYFIKPVAQTAGIVLEWNKDLRSFHPRISLIGQLNKATVNGWDIEKKEAVTTVQNATADKLYHSISGASKAGGAEIKTALSVTPETTEMTSPLNVQTRSKEIAAARITETESMFVQADGVALGDPTLLAGNQIDIKNIGTKFSGKYFITQARHEIYHGSYTVSFSTHGATPETLASLVSMDNSQANNATSDRIYGVIPGLITNIKDDLNMGRVKVKFPMGPKASGGAELETGWARLSLPGAGKDRGMFYMPEVNDEVLVAFEQGDINFPYVIGGLWNKKDLLPKGVAGAACEDGKVNERVIRSLSGHIISLNDKSGEESITIQDKTTKNSIVLTCKDNTITVKADKDIVFTAGGKITMTATGDISVDTKANVTMKATQKVSLASGSNKLELAPAGAKLEGSPMVEVKGAATGKFDGGGMTEIKGGLVKIN